VVQVHLGRPYDQVKRDNADDRTFHEPVEGRSRSVASGQLTHDRRCGPVLAPNRNAEEDSPAFSIYSGLGGLPQDPCCGGESSPRSQESCRADGYSARRPAHLSNQLFAALSRTNPSRRPTLLPATTTRNLTSISEMMT
jgi:hypothetical protein